MEEKGYQRQERRRALMTTSRRGLPCNHFVSTVSWKRFMRHIFIKEEYDSIHRLYKCAFVIQPIDLGENYIQLSNMKQTHKVIWYVPTHWI